MKEEINQNDLGWHGNIFKILIPKPHFVRESRIKIAF